MGRKTKIDWCDSTWNPVTGCLHGCEYCYARRQAERFGGFDHDEDQKPVGTQLCIGVQKLDKPKYIMRSNGLSKAPYPWFFVPTFHRYRLGEPRKWKEPRTIFVGSMCDLFGEWVPDEWIAEVLADCEAAPWHRYMFLTKNPKRYESVLNNPMPTNMWFGWSQEGPLGSQSVFDTDEDVNTFVSIEPLLRPFGSFHIRGVNWAIVGAETGNRKDKVIPEKKWVDDIASACREAGVPLFMKESLRGIMGDDFRQEFPWEV